MTDENDNAPDELDARIAQMAAEQQAEPALEATEPVEVTADTQEATEAAEDAPAAPAEPDDDADTRIQRLYYESREAKRRAKALEHEVEVLRGTRQETRDEAVAREAAALAQQMSQHDVWIKETTRIVETGRKEIKGFDESLNRLAANFPDAGGVPREITEAAMAEPGQEHKIINFYCQNPDLAEQLLTMTPVQRGAAVGKVAAKLTAPKAVSKAPPPIRPVTGSAAAVTAPAKDFSKMSTAEQIAYYDNEDQQKYKSRGY